ncbi:MAG TPA: hypothetical protein VGG97_05355 [Bryobacteraceae bacterium]|jgi:hypothetical protein
MTKFPAVLFVAALALSGRGTSQAGGPLAVAQRLFDDMATHNTADAQTLFTSEAMLFSVRPDGTSAATPHEKFVERMGASKDTWLERIWNPKVLEHGEIAIVWAEYDFHRNGKFSHCGVDSFHMLRTSAGWKIDALSDTRETTGCAPSPLGPPTK